MKTAIALIVVILIAVGGYFLFAYRAAAPEPASDAVTGDTSGDAAGGAAGGTMLAESEIAEFVTYSDEGFSPAAITVRVGDTVRFTNESSGGMWVGVDEHPTHTEYDGTSTREHCADGVPTSDVFDQCTRNQPGESWDYRFMKAGTFEYHNHAQASHGGTVTVTE